MSEQERYSIVAAAAKVLDGPGKAWRTHIQKLLYFAKAWGVADVDYSFVIHRYGPYAYDLDRDILRMESFGNLRKQWGEGGKGATYQAAIPTDDKAVESLRPLAEWLAPMSVKELEALATVEFVWQRCSGDVSKIKSQVLEIKPHLTETDVERATTELKKQRQERRSVCHR